jgi:mRNA-degrading endonuclease RelE of RelBE toxin-antitoxin system
MIYSIIPTERFKKDTKRLIKKYPSLKSELLNLNAVLEKNPETGIPLGNSTYKIRVAIRSKGKGKSGGARVISYLVAEENEIYLLTIFDKSEFENIEEKELRKIIESLTVNRTPS